LLSGEGIHCLLAHGSRELPFPGGNLVKIKNTGENEFVLQLVRQEAPGISEKCLDWAGLHHQGRRLELD